MQVLFSAERKQVSIIGYFIHVDYKVNNRQDSIPCTTKQKTLYSVIMQNFDLARSGLVSTLISQFPSVDIIKLEKG